MRFHPTPVAVAGLLMACLAMTEETPSAAAAPVDYGRDIQPILADRCYKCHGPDAAQRKADLRLDLAESVIASDKSPGVVKPGDAAGSELIARILSHDPDEVMPPPDSNVSLSTAEIDLLRRWVEEGAAWREHWAFRAPQRPALPSVREPQWPLTAVDRFVLARMEQHGLAPSPQADRRVLLRRVSLDLTGLPPTPTEMAAFLADKSPDAYGQAVDRLLASPRYGERMALPWLDAARYADTSGYQTDGPRNMWRWRDWVIEALNANMPFDQFTLEQIAGDLLPGATLQQKIATGFNRNHRANSEGGLIPEEFEVEYVVDRVDTTATVWLGLTLGCARCHDHKYDPLSQAEFYQLYAFFNNLPEHGRARKEGNSPPYLPAPTREQQVQLAALSQQAGDLARALNAQQPQLAAAQVVWEKSAAAAAPDWNFDEGLTAHFPLDGDDEPPAPGALVLQGGTVADATAGNAAAGAQWLPGRRDGCVQLQGRQWLDAGNVGQFGYFDKFTLAAWVHGSGGTIVSRMTDEPQGDGYCVALEDGKIKVYLVKRWLDDSLRVETAEAVVAPDQWRHVAVTYDGSRRAGGIQVFVDGEPQKMQIELDDINQSFGSGEPFRIGAGGGPDSRFQGKIDDVRVFDRQLSDASIGLLATATPISQIASTPVSQRTPGETAKLKAYFLRHAAPPALRELHRQRANVLRQRTLLSEELPDVMVMQELPQRRPAYILERGQYDKPGREVERGVPAALHPFPQGAPDDRLGLAQWLVDPANPLTARVAVNRAWQLFFGAGLVQTTEDFGTQGERPSHPELLDWLSVEFVESGWDLKRLHRLIVMSAVYRQSSHGSVDLTERDPENRWLSRGPRFRLTAHAVRDQALFAAGLLVEQSGGPSVKPYQPPGLWEEVASQTYDQDEGAALYRRSLYTYWKRTVAAPLLMTFDAANRETCIVRPARTNTPLQALALLNDTAFVEAARKLAERVLLQPGDDDQHLTQLYEYAVCRPPLPRERAVLLRGLASHRERFAERPAAAKEFLQVGESLTSAELVPVEVAAWAALANTIFNLDEVITKE
ncbi:DUF1553 domain-containing protein [Lignipirellula cremea]|uniref:Planctomycete cytochrome C n=1 Tax=Lignipirellula cremea TaxID=2528010 RepID=A0A518DTW6_9BACT|nr:DUF1553 domain-containing protein [Lignipirellula cremea]QDU95282.1 Planctomycete cytochrome C [Lignipirellula cremea]